MKYALFILTAWGILFASCKQSPRKQASSLSFSKELQDDTTGTKPAMSTADSIRSEQIRLHAELVYDSVSYLTIENNGVLPVRTDKTYQLMHYIHNQWKPVKVNQADTSSVTIAAGEKDTLWIHFKRQIGYEPIGRCSISKTFYSLSQPQCSIQKAIEAHTRSIIIDWNRCELIPDRTELTNLYVDMKAIPSEENLLLTIHNHSDQTLICGNETDYTMERNLISQDNGRSGCCTSSRPHHIQLEIPFALWAFSLQTRTLSHHKGLFVRIRLSEKILYGSRVHAAI